MTRYDLVRGGRGLGFRFTSATEAALYAARMGWWDARWTPVTEVEPKSVPEPGHHLYPSEDYYSNDLEGARAAAEMHVFPDDDPFRY